MKNNDDQMNWGQFLDYPMGWKDFGCKAPDKFLPADDAHHLAPWHISVIGALGDSLTV